MSTVTSDKLAYLETLKDAVATKADLRTELEPVKLELAAVRAELAIVKWVVGGIGFGVLLLVLRSF